MTLSNLANQHLKKIIPYTPGTSSDAVKRSGGVKNAIKLSSNESALGPAPQVLRALQKALPSVHRYPDSGCHNLRVELSGFLKVKPENLIFGNGSDELIVMAIRAFTEKKHEILTAKPTFLVYSIATRVHGAKLIEVPLQNYAYDLKSMRKKITANTKLIFIANPDNPTGSFVAKKELQAFIRSVPRSCVVFIDEAYCEYASHIKQYASCMDLIKMPNVIVSRTFSKAYGLSGLRIGYCAAHPLLIDALNRVREPFNVNSLAQAAAVSALKSQDYLTKVINLNTLEKERVSDSLKHLGCIVFPSATNFIMFSMPDADSVAQDLIRRGIIIRNLSGWGLQNCLRVTVSTPAENTAFIKAMKQVVKNLGKKS